MAREEDEHLWVGAVYRGTRNPEAGCLLRSHAQYLLESGSISHGARYRVKDQDWGSMTYRNAQPMGSTTPGLCRPFTVGLCGAGGAHCTITGSSVMVQ